METATLITLATIGLGGMVWALRVESRVYILESRYGDIIKRFDRLEERLENCFEELLSRMPKR